jgi:hypothetical protein
VIVEVWGDRLHEILGGVDAVELEEFFENEVPYRQVRQPRPRNPGPQAKAANQRVNVGVQARD